MLAVQRGRLSESKLGRVICLLLIAAAIWTCSCGPQGATKVQIKEGVNIYKDDATIRWDGDAIVQDAALARDEGGADLADVSVTVGISYYEDLRPEETQTSQEKEWSKTFLFAAWSSKERKTITIPAAPLVVSYHINGGANNHGAYVRLYNDDFPSSSDVPEPTTPYFEMAPISQISATEIEVKLQRSDTATPQDWGRSDFLVTCHREGDAALEKHRVEWPSWKKDGTVTLVLPLATYERVKFKGIVEIPPNGLGLKRIVSQDFTWGKK